MVIFTELEQDGKPVIIAIHLNRHEKNHEIHRIASIYPRSNGAGKIKLWVKQGLLKYIDKSKNPEWLQSAKLQLLLEEATQDPNQSILTNTDIINEANTKYRQGDVEQAPEQTSAATSTRKLVAKTIVTPLQKLRNYG